MIQLLHSTSPKIVLAAAEHLPERTTSPFKEDLLLGIANFSLAAVVRLFEQLRFQVHLRSLPLVLGEDWPNVVGQAIYSITAGNKGLVGLCGRAIEDEIAGRNAKDVTTRFEYFMRRRLPEIVAASAGFRRFLTALNMVYPPSGATLRTVAVVHEREALNNAILTGTVTVNVAQLPVMLIQEGVLVAVDDVGNQLDNVAQMLASPDTASIKLAMAAPIVTSALLARLHYQLASADMLPDGQVPESWTLDWLLDVHSD